MTLDKHLLTEGKMTKKFLMSLPEGSFIVSGVGKKINDKIILNITEYVLPLEKRELQWKKIKEVLCNNRKFWVFKNKTDWEEFEKSLKKL